MSLFKRTIGLCITFLLTGGFLVLHAQAYCGDGVVEADKSEICDDGNFIDRDGCSGYCQLEDIIPPVVSTVSIVADAQKVPASTRTITVTFSEPIDSATVLPGNFSVRHDDIPIPLTLSLSEDGSRVTLTLQESLVSEASHAIRIKSVRDRNMNLMTGEFIRVFTTATAIDRTPPFVVADPPAGSYGFAQNVSLISYLSETQVGLEFKEEGVRIFYTTDGSYPTEDSPLYRDSFSISEHTVLKFFGIDTSGNKSPVFTQVYRFECNDRPNAKRMSPYPLCRVLECEQNFDLLNGTCVPKTGGTGDYRDNAFTAPLFSSPTPLTVSSKSAIHITAEHKGLIRRPIIFKNLTRETEVRFEQNTFITDDSGRAFEGYLVSPVGRFIKDYPVNFGYSFKTIVEFIPPDGQTLHFDKPYVMSVLITDRFIPNEPVTVFTLPSGTNQYKAVDPSQVTVDWAEKRISISSLKTDLFFVAQQGESFTKAEFNDLENHWAKNYAEALYRKGIVKGRSKGIYAPDEQLTRAEFIKIALEAIGADVPPMEEVEDSPFPDVPLYAWYVGYVKKAKELNLVNGYADGTFHPEQPINRAEAVKILVSAFGFDVTKAETFKAEAQFKDVATGTWYYPAVNFAVKNGLLDGLRTPNGKILPDFGPGRNMSRGEMAQLAIEAIELKESDKAGN
ncbi:MAG: S-layer homology domain-containing protein [Candidatus Peregrinibacteria bacterium]